jgi:hypothetical protein
MQFSARVDSASACVRVQPSRLEWSLVGRQWVIQMAPMASISAVAVETGPIKSNLIVTTQVGSAEFQGEQATAEKALTLLSRLVAEAGEPRADMDAADDEAGESLINLKWMFDSNAESFDLDEEPARLLGF